MSDATVYAVGACCRGRLGTGGGAWKKGIGLVSSGGCLVHGLDLCSTVPMPCSWFTGGFALDCTSAGDSLASLAALFFYG